MNTKRWGLLTWLTASVALLAAQNQIDFRQQTNLRIDHHFTQDFSMAVMAAAILTNDFQEVGFAYLDAGLGRRLSPNLAVNANYRLLLRRNLYNAYDRRHILYADLDYTQGLPGRWSISGTLRAQSQFFNHLFAEGPRAPSFYLRTRVGLRYKINYYWQPFAESELFTPIFRPQNPWPNQIRASLGLAHIFSRYVRVEVYEQLQQQINSSSHNRYFMTAINWGLRF